MLNLSAIPHHARSWKILVAGHKHWDNDSYDQNARNAFRRAKQCKTPEGGGRVYASENEEWEFFDTCKCGAACTGCGNWATTQWQRDREWALPDVRYVALTFTMPDTLWPLFRANPTLGHKLAMIAARVVMSYTRVRKGVEVGVMPILQTFNGKLEFNPHVHLLVNAEDLLIDFSPSSSSVYFDGYELTRRWQRLLIVLLRSALKAGLVKPAMPGKVERLLEVEEKRTWCKTHVKAEQKRHFLHYGGRYLRRPPISDRHIIDISDQFVTFWYRDKRMKQRETVVCSIGDFIDRWAQHIPLRYRHAVRYFGLFSPGRWAKSIPVIFTLSGKSRPARPRRLPWAIGIQQIGKPNPLRDTMGRPMKFVRHVAPRTI